jgi:hypothetical protein
VGLEGGERRGTGPGLDHLNYWTSQRHFARAIEISKIFLFSVSNAAGWRRDQNAAILSLNMPTSLAVTAMR